MSPRLTWSGEGAHQAVALVLISSSFANAPAETGLNCLRADTPAPGGAEQYGGARNFAPRQTRTNKHESELSMVTKCANPSCGASFQYLRGGKLFLLDLPRPSPQAQQGGGNGHAGRIAEYFWLCDRCCLDLTVIVDGSGQAAVAKAHASGQG